MTADAICTLARRLMQHPAAPYHEHAVRDEVQQICAEHGLQCQRDAFGNVLIHLQTAARVRPFVLAAHLDHPGFEVVRQLSSTRWLLRFCGGVPDAWFRAGIRLKLMPGVVPAKLIRRVNKLRASGQRLFEVRADPKPQISNFQSQTAHSPLPRFAVWELEEFVVRDHRIYGRACDDLIGVAAVLATMIELKKARARVNVIGAITRAEEVSFHGALALAAAKGVPANSLVVSLETSRELPGVKMGEGVILRVGDRTSIFDSRAMRFLAETATRLKGRRKRFKYQRALMSGGTCEATAYQEFGFQTAAVCVALGNYHNCAAGNRIAAEFVSVPDVCDMVDLLVAAARQMPRFTHLVGKLPKRLRLMMRQSRPRLRSTA